MCPHIGHIWPCMGKQGYQTSKSPNLKGSFLSPSVVFANVSATLFEILLLLSISKNNSSDHSSCLCHLPVLSLSCFLCLLLQCWHSPGCCLWFSWLVMWYSLLQEFHLLASNKSFTCTDNSPICSFSLAFLLFVPIFIPLLPDLSNLMSHRCPLSCSRGTQFSFLTNLFLLYFVYWLMIVLCSQFTKPETQTLPGVLTARILFLHAHILWFCLCGTCHISFLLDIT